MVPPPSTTNPIMDSVNTDAYSTFFANTDSNSIDPSKLLFSNSDPILFSQISDNASELLDSNWSLPGSVTAATNTTESTSGLTPKRSYNSKKRKFTPANLFSALNNPSSNGNATGNNANGNHPGMLQQQSNSVFSPQLLFIDPNTGQFTSPPMPNNHMNWSPTINSTTGASMGNTMIPMTFSPPTANGMSGPGAANNSWSYLTRMRQMSPLMTNQYGDVLNMIPSNAHMTSNPSFVVPKVPVSRPISSYSSHPSQQSNGASTDGNGKQFLLPFYLKDRNSVLMTSPTQANPSNTTSNIPCSYSSSSAAGISTNAATATNSSLNNSTGNSGNVDIGNNNDGRKLDGTDGLTNMSSEVISSLLAARSPTAATRALSITDNDSTTNSSPSTGTANGLGPNNILLNLTDEVTDAATNFLKEYQKLNFNDVTVIEMKTILRRYGMDATGKKISLIERIKGIAKAIEQKALENLQQQMHAKAQLQEQQIQQQHDSQEKAEEESIRKNKDDKKNNDSASPADSSSTVVIEKGEEEERIIKEDEFAEFIELN